MDGRVLTSTTSLRVLTKKKLIIPPLSECNSLLVPMHKWWMKNRLASTSDILFAGGDLLASWHMPLPTGQAKQFLRSPAVCPLMCVQCTCVIAASGQLPKALTHGRPGFNIQLLLTRRPCLYMQLHWRFWILQGWACKGRRTPVRASYSIVLQLEVYASASLCPFCMCHSHYSIDPCKPRLKHCLEMRLHT